MKITIVLILLVALICSPTMAVSDEIQEFIHEFAHNSRFLWKGFQTTVHQAEEWNLPESCFGTQFEEDLYTVIVAIINILEEPNPIKYIIMLISKGNEIIRNVKDDCQVSDDWEELTKYWETAECGPGAISKRAYSHISRIRELVEDIESLSLDSESELIQAGGDAGNIATIVLEIKY